MARLFHLVAISVYAACGIATIAAAQAQHKPKSDAELIASAMSAAPPSISHDATVIAMDGDKVRTLRQGRNEFTCVPDDPGSPGNDPMCLQCDALASGMDGSQGCSEG